MKKTTQSQKSKKAGSSSDTDQVVTEKANRLAQQLSTQTKNAEYAKHDNPKDMKAARMRSDSKAWEKAAESEMEFLLRELQQICEFGKEDGIRGIRPIY